MSARITTLDERYGRTPSRRRRGRLTAVVAAAAVLVAVAAWAAWTGIGGAATSLDTTTTAVDVQGPSATEVGWLVSGRAGTRLVCAIEAQDPTGAVVGLVEVVVPVTGEENRAGSTLVRTVREASTGAIESCRDA